MIQVFYGDDRVGAKKIIEKILGDKYEVIEGAEMKIMDLPSIFWGGSLLASERAILIRDLGENKEVFGKIGEFTETPHKVIILEAKLDKRSVFYKELKDKIEFLEFKPAERKNMGEVFEIFRTAKKDGQKAVKMVEKIKDEQDPFMFFGLLVSQAVKDFSLRQGIKEKRVLKELVRLDILMKTSAVAPWMLVEGFLVRLETF